MAVQTADSHFNRQSRTAPKEFSACSSGPIMVLARCVEQPEAAVRLLQRAHLMSTTVTYLCFGTPQMKTQSPKHGLI